MDYEKINILLRTFGVELSERTYDSCVRHVNDIATTGIQLSVRFIQISLFASILFGILLLFVWYNCDKKISMGQELKLQCKIKKTVLLILTIGAISAFIVAICTYTHYSNMISDIEKGLYGKYILEDIIHHLELLSRGIRGFELH